MSGVLGLICIILVVLAYTLLIMRGYDGNVLGILACLILLIITGQNINDGWNNQVVSGWVANTHSR